MSLPTNITARVVPVWPTNVIAELPIVVTKVNGQFRLSLDLDGFADAQGAILSRGASSWVGLSPGASGTVLTSGGAGESLSWQTPSSPGLTDRLLWKGDWDASSGTLPASPESGDLYRVTVAGTVSGVSYFVGDYLFRGSTTWYRWPLGQPLEFAGTLDASGGAYPSSPKVGDIYLVTTGGTISGTTYAADDVAWSTSSGWKRLLGSAPVSQADIQNNAFVWCGDAGGSANALTLTPTPAIASLQAGQEFSFKATASNTGAATVSISGLSAVAIQKDQSALTSGAIELGKFYHLLIDGTNAQITQMSPSSAGGVGTLGAMDADSISADLLSDTTNTRKLGDSLNLWAEVHATTLFGGTTKTDTIEDKSTGNTVDAATVVQGTPTTWAALNGSGVIAIRDDFNVSSVVDGGTGVYTFNFTSAYAAADYSAGTGGRFSSSDAPANSVRGISSNSPGTSSIGVVTQVGNGGTTYDFDWVSVHICGVLA